jgi:hypothetical protein
MEHVGVREYKGVHGRKLPCSVCACGCVTLCTHSRTEEDNSHVPRKHCRMRVHNLTRSLPLTESRHHRCRTAVSILVTCRVCAPGLTL